MWHLNHGPTKWWNWEWICTITWYKTFFSGLSTNLKPHLFPWDRQIRIFFVPKDCHASHFTVSATITTSYTYVLGNIHILHNQFLEVSRPRPPPMSTNISNWLTPPSPLRDYVIYKWRAMPNITSITSLFCLRGKIYLIILAIFKNI